MLVKSGNRTAERGGSPDPPRSHNGAAVGLLAAWAMVAAAIMLTIGVGGCEPGRASDEIVLLFCTNNDGVLAACGCPSNPSGGLAKRQNLIESYRRTRPQVIIVDAGDLMPDRKSPIKAKYVAQVASRAGYDAIGLGDQEFLLGADVLRRLRREENLPLICANVRDAAGEFVVPPHVVREVAGRRIGIFAVIADEAYGFPPVEWRTGLKVEPPLSAARREVAALAGCDLVVVLSHQRLDESRRLAAEAPGIGVVVSGHDAAVLRTPEKIGKTLLVSTGEAGRILGALAITRGPQGRLDLALTMTELSAQVPDAKWVMDLYWKYVDEAKDKPPPDWDLTPIPTAYEPASECGRCHPEEYKAWEATRHAHAYASIKKAGRQNDPECILCHTMGLGRKGGFVSMSRTPDLGRVTCQACHTVTSDHVERKIKPEPEIYINSRLCMSCHGPVQSPNFDYFVYKPKILHKPGDQSSAVK